MPKREYIESEFITDICGGSYYREFRAKYKSHDETSEEEDIYLGFCNTDGISLCSKSNLSIWPVFLAIIIVIFSHYASFVCKKQTF